MTGKQINIDGQNMVEKNYLQVILLLKRFIFIMLAQVVIIYYLNAKFIHYLMIQALAHYFITLVMTQQPFSSPMGIGRKIISGILELVHQY